MRLKVFLLILSIFAAGCPVSYVPGGNEPPQDMPPLSWDDKIFESQILECGFTRTVFRTNNTEHWTFEGKTMWTVWGENVDFTSRTVEMSKASGYSGGGYGIVFCQNEHNINGVHTPAMLVVMINSEGQYIIGKAIGGDFIDRGWQTTAHLRTGNGAGNKIKVFHTANDEFVLNINDVDIESFRDDDTPFLRSGRNGYIVVITPFDNFPTTGIDVFFTEDK